MLGVDQFLLQANIENSADSRDQLNIGRKILLQFIRQTGGSREIISLGAIFDTDVHRSLQSLVQHFGVLRGVPFAADQHQTGISPEQQRIAGDCRSRPAGFAKVYFSCELKGVRPVFDHK